MNKAMISAAVLSVCGLSTFSTNAFAADAKLIFQGEVIASTCTVSAGTNGADTANGILVTLPVISASDLATPGATGGATLFQVVIGGAGETGCVGGPQSRASIAFDAVTPGFVDLVSGNLINSGTAENVQVALVNAETGGAVNVVTNDGVPQADVVDNTAVLNLGAQYLNSGAGAATPGTVDASVGFTVVYY